MTPDYIICLECETPCYTFEWKNDAVVEAICTTCGNEDIESFATEDEYEALATDDRFGGH